MKRILSTRFAAAMLVAAGLACAGAAQPDPQNTNGARARDPLAGAPPALRWGVRVAGVERLTVIAPVVVVVPDAVSYVEAISQWSLVLRLPDEAPGDGPRERRVAGTHDLGRFPVLIDDGSLRAREDIARFVRAYKPERVVRWQAHNAAWPDARDDRRRRIAAAAARAWGADTVADLPAAWERAQYQPTGVAVADESDPAWTAALAIAAFRGHPIVWAHSARNVDRPMSVDAALTLDKLVRDALEALGLEHRGLGTDVDSVAICMNTAAAVQLPAGDERGLLATTDVVGRLDGGISFAAPPNERPPADRRWAWAGQIFGDEPRAAYDAMCALFLEPSRAWLFDGYEDGPPWNLYDMTAAAEVLERRGLTTVVDDVGRQGVADWRRRAAGYPRPADADGLDLPTHGLNADLVFVTTSGMQRSFALRPGQGLAADAPMLNRPAAVHIVHSWSANIPAARASVAGRWIDRGAFVYVGSVHEPYLSAFVPTPALAERLVGAIPVGGAARYDGAAAWKIAIFGDPSWNLAGISPRSELPGSDTDGHETLPKAIHLGEDLAERVAEAASERRYADVVSALALTGKDEKAASVAAALVRDDRDAFDADVALAAIGPAFRYGEVNVLAAARDKIDDARVLAELKDMVWQLLWPRLRTLDAPQATLLARCIRPECADRDAAEAAEALERALGRAEAQNILAEIAQRETDAAVRRKILDAVRSP